MIEAFTLPLLVLLWAAIGSKAFVAVARVFQGARDTRWLVALERIVPSWRLFGQRGGSFDLFAVLGDRVEGGPDHFHFTDGKTRRWFHPIVNPHSKYRFVLREALQSVLFQQLSGRPERPQNLAAKRLLIEISKAEIALLHPFDYRQREASLYIVFDRGHHSSVPPEAKASLGPIRF